MTATPTPITDEMRTTILLAAYGQAGSAQDGDEYPIRLAGAVAQITAALRPGSALASIVDDVWGASAFVANIVRVEKEMPSTRALVVLKTGTSKKYPGFPPGFEPVRSDRTDNRSGLGVATARAALSLVGHRVFVYVVKEQFVSNGDDKSMRIVKAFVDLGISDDPDAVAGLAALQAARAGKVV